MKRALVAVLLALLIIPLSSVTAFADDRTAPEQIPGKPGAAPDQLPKGGQTVRFTYYELEGIALAVPSSWIPVDPDSGPLAEFPAEMRALIKFIAVNLSTGANAVVIQGPATGPDSIEAIEERNRDAIQQASSLISTQVVGQEQVLLPSGEALVTSSLSTFLREDGQTETLAQVSVVWVRGNLATVLTLTADSDDVERAGPIFEEIIESFRFL